MGVQKTEFDLRTMIEELQKENKNLNSEIVWRKDEAIALRRSIGSGRVYHKLRESFRYVQEENEALLKRLEEMEAVHFSLHGAQNGGTVFLKTIVQPLVEAGNAMQHKTWTECDCEGCTSWRKVLEDLCCRFAWFNECLGEVEWVGETGENKMLKASGI
jgi:superfamily I DNA/RNA helicase